MLTSEKRLIGNIVLFGLAGPPIGLLFILLVVQPLLTLRPIIFDLLTERPLVLLPLAGIAYLLGFIPAALAGIVNATFARSIENPLLRAASMICFGWLLSMIALIFVWIGTPGEPNQFLGMLLPTAVYGSAGGAAALCCHLLARRSKALPASPGQPQPPTVH